VELPAKRQKQQQLNSSQISTIIFLDRKGSVLKGRSFFAGKKNFLGGSTFMNEVNENIVKFLEKVANDEELQAKMQKATNPDEAYAIASGVQDGFTKEEFVEAMKELNAQTDQEVSDDDLEQVAGGKINNVSRYTKSVDISINLRSIKPVALKSASA
jgi:predicted ribosomally synthesized peptide with nif11-like leader